MRAMCDTRQLCAKCNITQHCIYGILFRKKRKKSNSAACFHIDIIDFKCMHTMTVCECVLAIWFIFCLEF